MTSLSQIRKQVAAKGVSKPSTPFKTLKGLFSLYKPFIHLLILSHLLNTVNLFTQLIRPHYWGGVIDIVTRSKDAHEFKETVLNMLVYFIISNIISRIHSKVKTKVSRSLNAKFKAQMYKIILEKDMEFFDKTPQPEVINVLGSGSTSLQNLLISELTGPFECIFNLCGTLILIYSISPQLTIFLLMLIPPKAFLTYYSHKADSPLMTRHMTLVNQMNTIPFSLVQNMLMIKLFSTEKKELEQVCDKKDELSEIEEITDQKSWKMSFIRGLVDQLLQLALIWYGGLMVFEGSLTAGDLSKFSLYCGNMINSTSNMQNKVRRLLQSLTQSQKMLDILNYESKVKLVNPNAIKKDELKGAISIKDVSFCYPSKPNVEVLQNINVNIKEGQSVAFVGQNGSGKTTINYLLQRLYDPTQGEITIDEINIKDYDVAWLHKRIGYVSQEPVLLDKTVEENIVYGLDSYSSEQIEKAIKISNSEFILEKDRFPDGLKTLIGANGVKLSGGEKQRIAISRALVRDPKILILDEPTSALDGESEVQVQLAINNMMKQGNMTVVVVAHKVSSIENCDKIYVYNQGKIVEEGNHKSLVEANGAYTKLFRYQISQKKIVCEGDETSKGM